MPSLPGLPPDIPAVVLPPPGAPGGDPTLPGGIGLLEDSLFYLELLGVSRAYVPGAVPGGRFPGGSAMGIVADPSMTPRQAAGLAVTGGRFMLVDSGLLRRQDVSALLRAGGAPGTIAAVALSTAGTCGGLPLLTSPAGRITGTDRAGEMTNAADCGLWLCGPSMTAFMPDGPLDTGILLRRLVEAGEGLAAEFCEGYTRRPATPVQHLVACGEILCGRVLPWSGKPPVEAGVLLEEDVDISPSARITGFLWARRRSAVGPGSMLENVVLMQGSSVGEGCRLRNALVPAGCRVRSGTTADDRAPKVLGR